MGTIRIEELTVEAVVGALPEERRRRQALCVTIEVDADTATPAASDDLADALDYRRMAEIVRGLAVAGRFRLVETLAERAVDALLAELPIGRARVEVRKPPAIAGARCAVVIVERAAG